MEVPRAVEDTVTAATQLSEPACLRQMEVATAEPLVGLAALVEPHHLEQGRSDLRSPVDRAGDLLQLSIILQAGTVETLL